MIAETIQCARSEGLGPLPAVFCAALTLIQECRFMGYTLCAVRRVDGAWLIFRGIGR
jgi:hypothetical protein